MKKRNFDSFVIMLPPKYTSDVKHCRLAFYQLNWHGRTKMSSCVLCPVVHLLNVAYLTEQKC